MADELVSKILQLDWEKSSVSQKFVTGSENKNKKSV